jgi:hypothetical protein
MSVQGMKVQANISAWWIWCWGLQNETTVYHSENHRGFKNISKSFAVCCMEIHSNGTLLKLIWKDGI